MEKRGETVPVREGYDRWAAVYDHDDNPLIALDESVVPGLYGELRGRRALELGCGTGRHTERLLNAGAGVTGLDLSSGMLEVARRRLASRDVELIEANIEKPLPVEVEAFDFVLTCLAVEHVRDLGALFAEVFRALRPGGAFLCSDMHQALRLRGNQANFDDPVDGTRVAVDGCAHPVSSYVMAALDAGFSIERVEEHAGTEELARACPRAAKYVGWPMLFVMRAVKPRVDRPGALGSGSSGRKE
jgi:ubiquinone/menaquinone biosynthesis C-methylase UbiE